MSVHVFRNPACNVLDDTRESDGHGLRPDGHAASGTSPEGRPERVAEWRPTERRNWELVSTGFPSLDQLLPAGGIRRGCLLEWIAGGDASGAISLACAVACQLVNPKPAAQMAAPALSARRPSTIVVVDRGAGFYPPAVMPWLDALDGGGRSGAGRPQFVMARPSRDDDELWTIDQALRCPGVAAVLAWPQRVHATAMRRWQLAARGSGAIGLIVRGVGLGLPGAAHSRHGRQSGPLEAVRREPSWADARVAILPTIGGDAVADLSIRRLRLSLVGGPWSGADMLEERSADVLLNLANGRDATHRHRLPARHGRPSAAGHGQPRQAVSLQAEGVACRAS